MEGALDVARNMERQGAEVIVSWGSTAVLLEKEISTPVVSIQTPDFSIMKAVEQSSKFSKKIIVMTHEPVSGLDMLGELYGVDIKQVNFTNQNDFRYGAIQAFNEGFEVIIGKGYFTIELAKGYGKKAVLINYDIKSVRQAFQEAIRIALRRRKEREEYIRLETIFNSLTEGVVFTNNLGKITLFNQAAEGILGIHADEALGRSVELVLPHSRVNEALCNATTLDDEFLNIGNINIVASHKPISLEERILGVVSTVSEASEIQKIHSKIRKQLTSKGFTAHYKIDHFSAHGLAMKKIIEQAKGFAATDSSILITGESGTGKEVLAQSIHRLSLRS
jgi:propionate catabolism operon transcriptional regulator